MKNKLEIVADFIKAMQNKYPSKQIDGNDSQIVIALENNHLYVFENAIIDFEGDYWDIREIIDLNNLEYLNYISNNIQ